MTAKAPDYSAPLGAEALITEVSKFVQDFLHCDDNFRDFSIDAKMWDALTRHLYSTLDHLVSPSANLSPPSPQLTHKLTLSGVKYIKDMYNKRCPALQDWPGRRKIHPDSGRPENAGQFVQRLLDEGLYDEERYGKLYLFDLRSINPKLYQALSQWQKRTGNKILPTKQDEIAELLEQGKPDNGDFLETARINNARWRHNRINSPQ